MIRRLKEDVLTELPAKQRNVIPLEIPNKKVAAQIAKQAAAFDEAEAARAKAEALQAKVGSVDAKERENTVEWKEGRIMPFQNGNGHTLRAERVQQPRKVNSAG